jgi:DNA-directed RNA polymerase II subunit RPB1
MDTLLGIRLFTKRDTFLQKEQVMNLMMFLESFDGNLPKPAVLKPRVLWTGKQILSMFIPEINLQMKNKNNQNLDDLTLTDSLLILDKGEILSGMFDKSIIGTSSGGLLHCIWLEYG